MKLEFSFQYGNRSEKTKVLLTSAAHVHLKHSEFSKHTRNLSPASRAILLLGPAGMLYEITVFQYPARNYLCKGSFL